MAKYQCLSALAFITVATLAGCDNSSPDSTKTGGTVASQPTASELNNAKNVEDVCALDHIDGVVSPTSWTVKKSVISTLGGWQSTSEKQAPAQFTLVLKGEQTYGFAVKTGGARPDVAKVLSIPALTNSGYTFTADFSNIPPGKYEAMTLTKVTAGGEMCNLHRQIIVVP